MGKTNLEVTELNHGVCFKIQAKLNIYYERAHTHLEITYIL